MDLISLAGDIPHFLGELMTKYGVGLGEVARADVPYFLWDGGALRFYPTETSSPLVVNFGKDALKYKKQKLSAKKDLLSRALGLDKNPGLRILDGTLGFGKDTFLLAHLGASMVAVERDPVPGLMVEVGLHQFFNREPLSQSPVPQVYFSDVHDILSGDQELPPVLYLDPMFSKAGEGALPKKNMAFLRHRDQIPLDFQKIFFSAQKKELKRIVVKRPRKGQNLHSKPSHEIFGKMIRFDVYNSPFEA